MVVQISDRSPESSWGGRGRGKLLPLNQKKEAKKVFDKIRVQIKFIY